MVPISSKKINSVSLHVRRPTWRRLDTWPFVLLYAGALLAVVALVKDYFAALIVFAFVGFLHVLTHLFCYWLPSVYCYVRCTRTDDIARAELCQVVPAEMAGSSKLCDVVPIQHGTATSPGFVFNELKFVYKAEKHCFEKLLPEIKVEFAKYRKLNGLTKDALRSAQRIWGPNRHDVPPPAFKELLKEQMLAPFFVFQVFCVALWCMDEYWYYSLFTLALLIVFESTVVKSRQKTMEDLATLSAPLLPVAALRCGKWETVAGEDLYPGDVVSLSRPRGYLASRAEEFAVPADLLLLAGSAIVNEAVLTGESTPQWKAPIEERGDSEVLYPKADKKHIVFGGTKLVLHSGDKGARVCTPDGGCLAVVLRTSFSTTQGKLMRTIRFSTERVTANNRESFAFIGVLLVFAIAAAGYVLHHGLQDGGTSRYKLLLNCALILTSVIPPELPMELTIAVNASLLALLKADVYCTEPFRIPFAGAVEVCCFDKTGTLTSDDLVFEGVHAAGAAEFEEALALGEEEVPEAAAHVLAACHSLVQVEGRLVGDPVERAALPALGWAFSSITNVASRAGGPGGAGGQLAVLHRHHFSSELRRMSVVARVEHGAEAGALWALAKGAPEVLRGLLAEVPPAYDAVYKHYARQGARVLALASKRLRHAGLGTAAEAKAVPRGDLEAGLTFAGFAVFACPIKPESKQTIRALRAANLATVMITGDAALTACHVASEVHIARRPLLILSSAASSSGASPAAPGSLVWTSPQEDVTLPYETGSGDGHSPWKELSLSYDLCVGGEALERIQAANQLAACARHVAVFARMSPRQKEAVVQALRGLGHGVLMCGDGTNDVGALRSAQVGVALLQVSGPAQTSARRRRAKPDSAAAEASSSSRRRKAASSKAQLRMLEEAQHPQPGLGLPVVKLGDASLASPFTAKAISVLPCVDILKRGRCTLVTTLQMFKILGLNCLMSAYCLSVQYLDGVKLGDTQATFSGMMSAMLFLFLSRAEPLPQLAGQRPHTSIFTVYFVASMLLQFAMHLAFLVLAVAAVKPLMPADVKVDRDGDFSPNLVNTVSWFVSTWVMLVTFTTNYCGRPFTTSLFDNSLLFYTLATGFVTLLLVVSGVGGEMLDDALELVPIPPEARSQLVAMAAADLAGAWSAEAVLRHLAPAPPSLLAPRKKKSASGKAKITSDGKKNR